MIGTNIKAAFVSTNSIVQGEQVDVLWRYLLGKKIIINFAHRTFKWSTDLKNDAQVYVVIIGFSCINEDYKVLFDYVTPDSEAMETKVSRISPYLLEQENFIVTNRSKPLCCVPEIKFGSMPNDDGNLILDDKEKEELINKEPGVQKWIKPFISAHEFIHNKRRWCICLKEAQPSDIKALPEVLKRVERIRGYRLNSKRKATIELAQYPHLFGEDRQPNKEFVVIPLHSSEKRDYIPMAFHSRDEIIGNSCCFISGATLFHFGVLNSSMHMAWVRQVCGRIKSDFRYSNKIVYNNFPWPRNVSPNSMIRVEKAASEIIAVRKEFSTQSLAELYDNILMPSKLRNSHKKLDLAVEACYRKKRFLTEKDRIEYLFGLYKEYDDESRNNKTLI